MDDYLPFALMIVLCINGLLFIGQSSIVHLAAEIGAPNAQFYDLTGSILCEAEGTSCGNGTYVLDDSDPTSRFPTSQPIESGNGGFFTDMFASIRTYFSESLGLGYVINVLSAPNTFLKLLGLPNEISFVISALWYLFTLFLLLAFIWGR